MLDFSVSALLQALDASVWLPPVLEPLSNIWCDELFLFIYFLWLLGSSANSVNWRETMFQQWCPVTGTAGISRTRARQRQMEV